MSLIERINVLTLTTVFDFSVKEKWLFKRAAVLLDSHEKIIHNMEFNTSNLNN